LKLKLFTSWACIPADQDTKPGYFPPRNPDGYNPGLPTAGITVPASQPVPGCNELGDTPGLECSITCILTFSSWGSRKHNLNQRRKLDTKIILSI